MVLILKKRAAQTPRQQVDELLRSKKAVKPKHAWNKFFGKIKWSDDAVAYQRKLRNE